MPLRDEGPDEKPLRRGIGRLLHVDDTARIEAYRRLLAAPDCPDWRSLSDRERRYARMLAAQLGDQVFKKTHGPEDAWPLLWQHPQVRSEAAELLSLLSERVDHVHVPLKTHPDVPLAVHARYTRIEILAGFGDGDKAKVAAWQTVFATWLSTAQTSWPSRSTRPAAPFRPPRATATTRSRES
jgi:hypothetical protein